MSDPELVPNVTVAALGIHEDSGRPELDTLQDTLAGRRMLVLLDNCEHLIDACVKLADRLLLSCPEVHLLATSREPLGIAGETVYRVPPLSIPEGDGLVDTGSSEAVELFLERARDQGHEVALDDRSALVVAELCRGLDGMPLAIELACARLRTMALDDIAARLDQRFRLLTGGSRASLPRQQTLRALIDWSYELLNEPECVVLERLSVFAGSFDLSAAEDVGATDFVDSFDVAEIVSSLVDKSLVLTEGNPVELRYRLLETIRQYAAVKLVERGELDSASIAHARHYVALAEEAAPRLRAHGQAECLDRLDVEHDNLRIAFDRLLAIPDVEDELPLRLGIALAGYWGIRHSTEGIESLQAILDRADPNQNRALRATALGHLARAHHRSSGDARDLLDEALPLSVELDLPELRTELLFALAWAAFVERRYEELEALSLEALELAQSTGSPWLIGRAHERRGMAKFGSGPITDRKAARAHLRESIEWLRMAGDRSEEARAMANLSNLEAYEGDYARAREGWTRVLTIAKELHDDRETVFALAQLGLMELLEGEPVIAVEHLRAALRLMQRIGIRDELAYLLLFFGLYAARVGQNLDAVLLFGVSERLFEELGIPCEELEDGLRRKELDRMHHSMGESFESTLLRGRHLSVPEAVKLALGADADEA